MTESVPCSHWIGPFPLFRKRGVNKYCLFQPRLKEDKEDKRRQLPKNKNEHPHVNDRLTGCVAAAVQQHPTGEYTLARERPPLIYRNPTRGSIDSAYLAASRPLAIASPPLGTTPSPIRKLSHKGLPYAESFEAEGSSLAGPLIAGT